jgi:ABC-2 type transport system permease protein
MLFISPPTYVAAVLFLCLMGFLYWAILSSMVNTPSETLPTVQFFSVFWIPVFFVVPLLTMRSIAGERKHWNSRYTNDHSHLARSRNFE